MIYDLCLLRFEIGFCFVHSCKAVPPGGAAFSGRRTSSEALVLAGQLDQAESEYHRVQRVRAKKANLWQSAETTLPRLIISSYLLAPVEMIMFL